MKDNKNLPAEESPHKPLGRFFETNYARYQQPLDLHEWDRVELVARRMHPTVQEHVVGSILNTIDLRYCPQWVWHSTHEPFIFDFLIEPRWVLECSLSQRQCARTKHWLKERATIIDRKFKVLKRQLPHLFTAMFLEAPNCPPNALRDYIAPILEYTNKLLTTIDEVEDFAQQWQRTQTHAGMEHLRQALQRATSSPDFHPNTENSGRMP